MASTTLPHGAVGLRRFDHGAPLSYSAVVKTLRPSPLGAFIPWQLKNQNHIAFVVWRFDPASTITFTTPSSHDALASPPEALLLFDTAQIVPAAPS